MSTPAKIAKRKLRRPAAQSIPYNTNHHANGVASKDEVPLPQGHDENADRERRMQAIDLIFGMWKDRDDVPKDGLAFQQELRKEW